MDGVCGEGAGKEQFNGCWRRVDWLMYDECGDGAGKEHSCMQQRYGWCVAGGELMELKEVSSSLVVSCCRGGALLINCRSTSPCITQQLLSSTPSRHPHQSN